MAITMTKEERKAFKDVEDKYQSSKEKLMPKFKEFKEFEEIYHGKIKNETNPWKSEINDPESYEKVERMTSHLVAVTPKGTFLPQEVSDTFNIAVADELYKFQWDNPKQEMHRKLADMVKMAGMYGTSFGLLTWMWDRREQEIISKKGKTKWVQLWDEPFFKPLDPRDVFPDPSATDANSLQWVIVNQYFTYDELKGQNGKYEDGNNRFINLTILKEKLRNKKDITASRDITIAQIDGRKNANGIKDRILVRTMFSREKWVSICPDYNLVIENHPNPYQHFELPIHILIDQNVPNQLYGMGEIEPIMPLQKGLNSVVNQRSDNVRLILNGMFKVKHNAKYAYTWRSEPGAKWVVEDPNDVEPFVIPDVTANTFLVTANYFKDAMTKATGNFDVLNKGLSGRNTATEAKIASGEQNARLRSKENFLDQFVRRLSNQWMQLNQQFLQDKTLIRIVGVDALRSLQSNPAMFNFQETDENGRPSPRQVTYKGNDVTKLMIDQSGMFGFLVAEPEDIQGSFDFVVETGSTLASDQSQSMTNTMTAVDILTKLVPMLQAEGKGVSFAPLATRLVTLLTDIKNPDDVITNAQPMGGMPQAGMEQLPMNEQMP